MTSMTTGEARAPRNVSAAPVPASSWDAKRRALVRAKQVKTLYRHSAPVLLTNVGNALIIDVVLWNRASHPFLIAWTTMMLAMTAARIELRRRYWQADPAPTASRPWEVRFLTGTVVAGVLWGAAGWVLSTPRDASAQFLIAFVIAGMVAGAAGSLSCHLPAFFLYLFPATLPLFVRWLLEGDSIHFGMAAMMALFAGAFSLIALNVNQSISEAFYLRSENVELLEKFRTAIDGSEDLFSILDSKLSERGDIVDFTIVDLNRKAKEVLSPHGPDPVGRSIAELLPDFASSERLGLYAHVVASGVAAEREYHAETGPLARMYVVEQIVPIAEGVAITCRDLTRRRENELRLNEALLAKENLLKEVHHRVKNNLQLLLSMLNLQADVVTDPRTIEIIRDIQDRLHSIATVHERLSQSLDSGRIDLERYLRMLVHDLFQSHRTQSAGLRHTVELPPIELHSNDVMLCGLVVNELVTNAIKHGFPDGRKGEVRVVGKDLGHHRLSITVSDDGVGFPPGEQFASRSSLGLQLVHVLAQQLNGKVDMSRGQGTKVELTFDVNR
jgi:two-component sensor histidine kinase/PAS domain-containing protein